MKNKSYQQVVSIRDSLRDVPSAYHQTWRLACATYAVVCMGLYRIVAYGEPIRCRQSTDDAVRLAIGER